MPFALILIAIGLIAAGVRGSYKDLGTLLVADFTGSGNFLNWLVAIGIVGCIGYVPQLRSFSRAFIALILVTMFVKNGTGIWAQFQAAIQGASAGAAVAPAGAPTSYSGGSYGGWGTQLLMGTPNANSGVLGTSLIPDQGSGAMMGP